MRFIIGFIWFPSLFSLLMKILVSASGSVSRTIRVILESLELGLVLGCIDAFKNLSLEEKFKYVQSLISKDPLV
jgi:hypothetical protein